MTEVDAIGVDFGWGVAKVAALRSKQAQYNARVVLALRQHTLKVWLHADKVGM